MRRASYFFWYNSDEYTTPENLHLLGDVSDTFIIEQGIGEVEVTEIYSSMYPCGQVQSQFVTGVPSCLTSFGSHSA